MRKVVIALSVGLVFYAESDIMLWQRIFEQHNLSQFDNQYQTGHVSILVAMIGIGVVLLWDRLWSLWYAMAFYTLSFSGLEDVLYYWFDGRAIPSTLPWLNDGHGLIVFQPVTNISLCINAGIWIGFWVATLIIIHLMQRARAKARVMH